MSRPLRVCAVTGTRADYGILQPVLRALRDDPAFELQLAVTGMHLSPEFGSTYRVVLDDGFVIHERIEMLLSSDSAVGTAKSIGLGTIGFAEALDRLRPDLLLVLGDRFEILAAVQAAMILRIPVAHLSGGDSTLGAFDEAIRHSITKMSHLHFVTNAESARRVRQMGEDPGCVFDVGSPAIDRIHEIRLLDRARLEEDLEYRFRARNLLITFHPSTLDEEPATSQFQALLDALDQLGPEVGLVFTKPNADPEGRALISMLDRYVADRPHATAHASLGQTRYYSVLSIVNAVIGNSSSGIYEAPSFRKPTVNIGRRQAGRLRAASILDCPPRVEDIAHTIQRAFELDCSGVVSPYGDGNSTRRILDQLRTIGDPRRLLIKSFRVYPSTDEECS